MAGLTCQHVHAAVGPRSAKKAVPTKNGRDTSAVQRVARKLQGQRHAMHAGGGAAVARWWRLQTGAGGEGAVGWGAVSTARSHQLSGRARPTKKTE